MPREAASAATLSFCFIFVALTAVVHGAETDGTNTSSTHADSHGGHTAHQYHALFYLFNAIIIGTAVVHVTTYVDTFRGVQPTVALFVLGMGYALFIEIFDLTNSTGFLGTSYNMWMDIDPHLLLFTLLPVLLTGDAMNIDTSVARLVAAQCLYLSCPAMLMCSFLTALFLWSYLPYGWSFLLCLTVGSILAATDPVAVVALLKELGASPILTVQIQGESLLNDGTAIVLYTIAYNMAGGKEYTQRDVVMFLLKTAFCAWFLGTFIGTIFAGWIRAASSRVEHSSAMIQASLTLCCAYMSFYIAEGVFEISGVLSTVAAALVLADSIWPHVVAKQAMHEVWHMLEYFANTAIFFLGGSLTAKSMIGLKFKDYLHLLYIYIVITVVRGGVLFASLPILRVLSPDRTPVTKADAIVMTWGGLRGAVGLALAISVNIDRADGAISQEDADRVLFFTAGIATLTLVVNASTSPWLVKFVGITKTPTTKRHIMANIHQQLGEIANTMCHNKATKAIISRRLEEMEAEFVKELPRRKAMMQQKPSVRSDSGIPRPSHSFVERASQLITESEQLAPSGNQVLNELEEAKLRLDRVTTEDLDMLGEMPPLILLDKEEEMCDLVRDTEIDPSMQRALTEVFLLLVRSQYWAQIEAGRFAPGTKHAESLLNSVSSALHHSAEGLTDLAFIEESMGLHPLASRGPESQGGSGTRLRFLSKRLVGMFSTVQRRFSVQSDTPIVKLQPPQEGDNPQQPPTEEDEEAEQEPEQEQDFLESEQPQALEVPSSSRTAATVTSSLQPQQLLSPTAATPRGSQSMTQSRTPRRKKMRRAESASWHVSQQNDLKKEEEETTSSVLAATSAHVSMVYQPIPKGWKAKLIWVTESIWFNFGMMAVIATNTLLVLAEGADPDGNTGVGWLLSDFIFTMIFLAEFLMKFGAMGLHYFRDGWNALDFMCVVLAAIGLVGRLQWTDVTSKEADVMRLNRVFRVMRLARAFGLVHVTRILRARWQRLGIDPSVGVGLDIITIMVAYARAHILTHHEFLKYFGEHGTFETCEEVRCLLESRTGIYTALYRAVKESRKLDQDYLHGLCATRESMQVTKELGDFVMAAHEYGILNQQEAEVLYDPLKQHMATANTLFRDSHLGIMRVHDLHVCVGEDDEGTEEYRRAHFAGGCTFKANFHRHYNPRRKSQVCFQDERGSGDDGDAASPRSRDMVLESSFTSEGSKTSGIEARVGPDPVATKIGQVHIGKKQTSLISKEHPRSKAVDLAGLTLQDTFMDDLAIDDVSTTADASPFTRKDKAGLPQAPVAFMETSQKDVGALDHEPANEANGLPLAPQPLPMPFTAPPTSQMPRIFPGTPGKAGKCDGLPGTSPGPGERSVLSAEDSEEEDTRRNDAMSVPGCVAAPRSLANGTMAEAWGGKSLV
mmetsp:Transcript_58289/g.138898  ORF Transcript_58289/g.138898 Transcript_58289/m.138898 type:complete len:1414 (-) Transcript_58289:78-4319(-)